MFKPTGSSSGLKCRRRQLKVSPDRQVEPAIEHWTPGTMSFLGPDKPLPKKYLTFDVAHIGNLFYNIFTYAQNKHLQCSLFYAKLFLELSLP